MEENGYTTVHSMTLATFASRLLTEETAICSFENRKFRPIYSSIRPKASIRKRHCTRNRGVIVGLSRVSLWGALGNWGLSGAGLEEKFRVADRHGSEGPEVNKTKSQGSGRGERPRLKEGGISFFPFRIRSFILYLHHLFFTTIRLTHPLSTTLPREMMRER